MFKTDHHSTASLIAKHDTFIESPSGEPAAGQAQPRPPLAIWGGIECTINRVGDAFFT
jgi:hypothetical protein